MQLRLKAGPALALAFAGALSPTTASAEVFSVTNDVVDFDRWNYPFNFTPGTRPTAPTFLAAGTPAFDERDGQFLIGFNTAALGVPTGRDPGDYQVQSLTITATHSTGAFAYDATYDSALAADTDAGRPILLTGAGLRGGFTAFTFGAGSATAYAENSPFGDNGPTPGAPDAQDRNAFAAAFDGSGNLVDISNNLGSNFVGPAFDFTPWAVGQAALTPGDAVVQAVAGVSPGSTFVFTVDLTDPNIRGYVQQGFADGGLFFSITSQHETSQSGGTSPNFYTRNNFDPAAVAPRMSFGLTVVPEPASLAVLTAAGLAVAGRRGVRRRA